MLPDEVRKVVSKEGLTVFRIAFILTVVSLCGGLISDMYKPCLPVTLMLLSLCLHSFQCCFTSAEAMRSVRDVELRMSTSSFT